MSMTHPAPSSIRLTLVTLLLAVAACSPAAPAAQQPSSTAPAASASDPAKAASAPARRGSSRAKVSTASQMFDDIARQVPEAALVKVYTEDNDPNDLLGRPNGYTSKIAFSDSRVDRDDVTGTAKDAVERGGSIEVFSTADLAKGRADYIQRVLTNSGLGSEYDYLRGPVLVRVTGNLSPTKAKVYEKALG